MSARITSIIFGIEKANGGTLSPYAFEYLIRQLKLKETISIALAYTLITQNIRRHGQIGLRVGRLSPGTVLKERSLINKMLNQSRDIKPSLKKRTKTDKLAYWDEKKRAMHGDFKQSSAKRPPFKKHKKL